MAFGAGFIPHVAAGAGPQSPQRVGQAISRGTQKDAQQTNNCGSEEPGTVNLNSRDHTNSSPVP
jgi:hypothetical protein